MHPYFGLAWAEDEEDHEDQEKQAKCGSAEMGASGPWMATVNSCNKSDPTQAACCCQSKCEEQAGCKGWQLMTSSVETIQFV